MYLKVPLTLEYRPRNKKTGFASRYDYPQRLSTKMFFFQVWVLHILLLHFMELNNKCIGWPAPFLFKYRKKLFVMTRYDISLFWKKAPLNLLSTKILKQYLALVLAYFAFRVRFYRELENMSATRDFQQCGMCDQSDQSLC